MPPSSAERLAALEQRLTAAEALLDPQAMREALEWTWNPRGLADELLVQDAAGLPLTRRKTLQFDGDAVVTDDPAGGRTVISLASTPPPAAAGGISHTVVGGYMDNAAAAPITGLGCTVVVPDDGSGSGAVLFTYGVAFRAYNAATTGSVGVAWDFRVDGSQVTPSATGSPSSARPSVSLVSISAAYFIHTAPSGTPTASAGADTDTSGGLAVAPGGGGSGFGPVPASPIIMRLAAGTRTVDVYWTVSGGTSATQNVSIESGMSACIPLGV